MYGFGCDYFLQVIAHVEKCLNILCVCFLCLSPVSKDQLLANIALYYKLLTKNNGVIIVFDLILFYICELIHI